MLAYYVKDTKSFFCHLGLSRHFDFLAWQLWFYFTLALEPHHIKK
jgi:hypothetical protein